MFTLMTLVIVITACFLAVVAASVRKAASEATDFDLHGREASADDKSECRNKLKDGELPGRASYQPAAGVLTLSDGSPVLVIGPHRALRAAVVAGHVDVVRELLTDERVDPTAFGDFALNVAASCGFSEIVEMLAADDRVDPSVSVVRALRFACEGGHLRVVERLLPLLAAETKLPFEPLVAAAAGGHVAIIDLLLTRRFEEERPVDEGFLQVLRAALEGGNELAVERLLAEPRLTAAARSIDLLAYTLTQGGRIDLLQKVLSRPGAHVDSYRYVFYEAAAAGNMAALQLMLEHHSTQAALAPLLRGTEDFFAAGVLVELLCAVAQHGSLAMIDGLVSRVNFTRGIACSTLSAAAAADRVEVVQRLLAEPADAIGPEALQAAAASAARAGNDEVLSVILADERFTRLRATDVVQAALITERAFSAGAEGGRLRTLQWLLADPRLTPIAGDGMSCFALQAAVLRRQFAAARLLLADPRVAALLSWRNFFWRPKEIAAAARTVREAPADQDSHANSVGFQVSLAESTCVGFQVSPAESCTVSSVTAEAVATAYGGAAPSARLSRLRWRLSGMRHKAVSENTINDVLFEAAVARDLQALGACLQHPLCRPSLVVQFTPTWRFAFGTACSEGHVHAVALLLAAHPFVQRTELQEACRAAAQSGHVHLLEFFTNHPRTSRVFATLGAQQLRLMVCWAAGRGHAHALATLLPVLAGRAVPGALAEGQRLPASLLGASLIEGFEQLRSEKAGDAWVAPLCRMLQVHAVTRAVASTPAPHPLYIRNLAGGALSAAAWARRRHVVAARVRALEED